MPRYHFQVNTGSFESSDLEGTEFSDDVEALAYAARIVTEVGLDDFKNDPRASITSVHIFDETKQLLAAVTFEVCPRKFKRH